MIELVAGVLFLSIYVWRVERPSRRYKIEFKGITFQHENLRGKKNEDEDT